MSLLIQEGCDEMQGYPLGQGGEAGGILNLAPGVGTRARRSS